jgi:hypothetical protein
MHAVKGKDFNALVGQIFAGQSSSVWPVGSDESRAIRKPRYAEEKG